MQIDFAKHERLLHKLAYQFHRRAVSAGAASVQLDDVFSEMCVAWCLARDAFDHNGPVPFTAFLVRGVRNHVNRWIGKQLNESQNKVELDNTANADMADGSEIHNYIADERAISPEAAAIDADHRAVQRELLSPLAIKFLEILENPPPAIYQILDAMQAKRAFAESRGMGSGFIFKQIKAPLIFDLMGVDQSTRREIKKELALYAALEDMCQ